MELTATERDLIIQAINTHLRFLSELECMAEPMSYMVKQTIVNESVLYKKLKKKISA